MFHQDLSFSRDLLSISWKVFCQNTFGSGAKFDEKLKLKKFFKEDVEILCPRTPYASNASFRRGLFEYFKQLRTDQRKSRTSQLASYLINYNDNWIPVANEEEYRHYYLKTITISISLKDFNIAFKGNCLSGNGGSISSYALRRELKFNNLYKIII